MKILLDTCVWGGCRDQIRGAGHEVEWAGDWPEDPGDEAILDYAHRNGRVLVTLDKDYGELAIVRGRPHAGIIRIVGGSVTTFARRILYAVARYPDELSDGAVITVERHRLRVRHEKTS